MMAGLPEPPGGGGAGGRGPPGGAGGAAPAPYVQAQVWARAAPLGPAGQAAVEWLLGRALGPSSAPAVGAPGRCALPAITPPLPPTSCSPAPPLPPPPTRPPSLPPPSLPPPSQTPWLLQRRARPSEAEQQVLGHPGTPGKAGAMRRGGRAGGAVRGARQSPRQTDPTGVPPPGACVPRSRRWRQRRPCEPGCRAPRQPRQRREAGGRQRRRPRCGRALRSWTRLSRRWGRLETLSRRPRLWAVGRGGLGAS